mmetsp:Transcript_16765/g.33783  ORF Transcript_16765/g.33783 Transcript_16765/m.33783 type:complete len:109 (+) Transcript_16765:598-924(+)
MKLLSCRCLPAEGGWLSCRRRPPPDGTDSAEEGVLPAETEELRMRSGGDPCSGTGCGLRVEQKDGRSSGMPLGVEASDPPDSMLRVDMRLILGTPSPPLSLAFRTPSV